MKRFVIVGTFVLGLLALAPPAVVLQAQAPAPIYAVIDFATPYDFGSVVLLRTGGWLIGDGVKPGKGIYIDGHYVPGASFAWRPGVCESAHAHGSRCDDDSLQGCITYTEATGWTGFAFGYHCAGLFADLNITSYAPGPHRIEYCASQLPSTSQFAASACSLPKTFTR